MAKLNLNRIEMPRQDPLERGRNFEEVALGYTPEMAAEEASRCLNCPKRFCVSGCPVNVDIPEFIVALKENDLPKAAEILKRKNALPGICGRVCPQESQCESQCIMNRQGAPVAIGRLERYVADWERENPSGKPAEIVPSTGKKVAVVGTGPAGLTCAAELAMLGHKVDMFEALHVAGGVLMYGIPEFRLPKEIVQGEVKYVESLGVTLELNAVVGKIDSVDELLAAGYDAVFLGTGAGLPMFLGVPGENLSGVYSANEFLTRVNLMKAYLFPEYDTPVQVGRKVAVIGGGNVAMDAARCALRLGAEVSVIYRRSREEMPARHEEVENAEEEGIKFRLLTNPTGFTGDEKLQLKSMQCVEMELGEPDASGRRRPIVKPGSDFSLDVDVAVIALGTTPNPLIAQTTVGLETNKRGTVVADEATGKTKKDRVWAGGDVVTGSATVISAMGAAKRAAADMDRFLRS
ncbi:MAG: NADPH-dependent glutamate synthase [Dehalococcoidia bacterium]|nr:NADPH-dependent glutamate synthase [Dehalococcoidia bacterium]